MTVDLSLGVDAADIFEIRGYAREATGIALPVVAGPDRLAFGHLGRDEQLRRTQVAFSDAEVLAVDELPEAAPRAGGRGRPPLAARGRAGRSGRARLDDLGRRAAVRAGGARSRARGHASKRARRREVDEAVGHAAYDAWRARDGRGRQSDNELFDRLIERSVADLRLLLNDGPRPDERYLAAGVPWFATLFGRDAIISAYEIDRLPARARRRHARGPRRPPGGGRRPADRRRAGQDPPRGPDRRDGPDRRAPVRDVLRQRRCDPAVADPARRDPRLDRRRRPRRPALAERPGGAGLDRPLRRPRRRRVRRVPPAGRARPRQPGLEGLDRRDPRPDRPDGRTRRSRWPRSRATSTTRSAGWPGSPGGVASASWPTGSSARPTQLRTQVRRRVLGARPRLLRDGPRRRQAADGRARLERRPGAVGRDRRPGARRDGRRRR